MNWLRGLVAPTAQYIGSQQPGFPQGLYPGQPTPDAPPIGGYVAQPMPGGIPPAAGGFPDPNQWQVGTRAQGSASATASASSSSGQGAAALEARCAQLSNDVASLALFARTLLTMLEDAKVVTREQFIETKNRLDALDGKLDDR